MTSFQKKSPASKKAPEKKIEPRKSASSSSTQISSVTNLMAPALSLSKACPIVTKTWRPAPDGTPDTRNVVGVGEQVEMTLPKPAKWSASAGTLSPAKGTLVIWTAPATDMDVEITATLFMNQKCSTIMKVVAPNAISMTKAYETSPFKKSSPGASMYCRVAFLPRNVCLGAIQWLEDPGPATDIMGYFELFPATTLAHKPNPQYERVDDQNFFDHDQAATDPNIFFPPSYEPGILPGWVYRPGAFAWKIPNRYKLASESGSSGRYFARTVQIFLIDTFGTMTIHKAGASVSRKLGQ